MSLEPITKTELNELDSSLEWSRDRHYLQTGKEFNSKISVLSNFECWHHTNQIFPYLIFESSLSEAEKQRLALDFLICLNIKQENSDLALKWLLKVLQEFQLSFATFHYGYLSKIIEEGDPHAEAFFLDHCVEFFESPQDTEACLERLSMLFEKKLHKSNLLEDVYQRILEVNPNNLKALKFFKLALLQAGDWEEGANFLRRILANARNAEEMDRTAQELASILLYQLDRPEEAIEVLSGQSQESKMDNTSILFEAYRRLGSHQEAIALLEKLLNAKDRTPTEKSTLLFKKGEILSEAGNEAEAARNFNLAIEHDSNFLEAYEKIISINLSSQNWEGVLNWLKEMRKKVSESELQSEIDYVMDRIRNVLP